MSWFYIGVTTVGVGVSLYGAAQADKGASAARAAGRASGKFILEETEEETRRLRFEQRKTLGTSRAIIAASGFRSGADSMGASSKAYMMKLKDVQEKELAWLQKAGVSRADIAVQGGYTEGKRLQSQATGLYGQAILTGLQGYGNYQAGKSGGGP